MSETRKPFWIGAFLLGGLALLVLALLVLGRDGWSSTGRHYVVYFTGALDGLDVGANVTYRGVTVGTVQEIRLSYDPELQDVVMPVVVRIDPDVGDGRRLDELLGRMVERGLRAQLQTQSLLTGKAIVALDFFPGQPGYVRAPSEQDLPVIPSVPSRVDQAANLLRDLTASLRELPFGEMVLSANRILQSLERLSGAPEVHDALADFAALLKNVESLSGDLQRQIPPILDNARQGSAELGLALAEVRAAAVATQRTLQQLEQLSGEARATLGPESEVRYELLRTLDQLGQASKTLQRTAEDLQQQPQSLIFGKPR